LDALKCKYFYSCELMNGSVRMCWLIMKNNDSVIKLVYDSDQSVC
jgi:hypothetical protein